MIVVRKIATKHLATRRELFHTPSPAKASRKTTRLTRAVQQPSDRFEKLSSRARNRPEARRSGEWLLQTPVHRGYSVSLRKEKTRRISRCLAPRARRSRALL